MASVWSGCRHCGDSEACFFHVNGRTAFQACPRVQVLALSLWFPEAEEQARPWRWCMPEQPQPEGVVRGVSAEECDRRSPDASKAVLGEGPGQLDPVVEPQAIEATHQIGQFGVIELELQWLDALSAAAQFQPMVGLIRRCLLYTSPSPTRPY